MSDESAMRDLFDRWERVWVEGQLNLVETCVASDGKISEKEFKSRFPSGRIIFDELPGANADSQRVADMFKKQEGRLFAVVHSPVLPDRDATTMNLTKAITNSVARAQPGDVIIFSFSGHGYSNAKTKTEFFLGTYDVDPTRPTDTALTGRELTELLAPAKGSVVLFLDTCQSGGVLDRQGAEKVVAGPEDLTGLVNTLGSSERGIVVFSSSSEEQESFEFNGAGYFTLALGEGIGGAAAVDGKITCTSLQKYLLSRVPELVARNPMLHTYRQNPSMIMPKGVPDFSLAEP